MAYDDTKIKEANEELEKRLASDRDNWKGKISELVGKLKNTGSIR